MRPLILLMLILMSVGIRESLADTRFNFGPQETRINGSIPYSVIGKYKAQFRHFKGRITLDDHVLRIQSVDLAIEANSITSNCPWCDKIVRSRRLLNTAQFPDIIFKSKKILRDKDGYKVKGIFAMHGVAQEMTFPFSVTIDQRGQERMLDLQGTWVFNRKSFNIIWNKLLDRGGVLVGDEITVQWGIKSVIKGE